LATCGRIEPYVGIIDAKHGHAVEGQLLQEVDEGLPQPVDRMTIRFHVVYVDIGDHGRHGLQMQEGGVGLVGLHDDELSRCRAWRANPRSPAAADHECRIHARFGKDASHEARGRRLAVGARDGDALLEPEQLGEHEGTGHDRHGAARARDDFRIVL
jgi:hypothetical protein